MVQIVLFHERYQTACVPWWDRLAVEEDLSCYVEACEQTRIDMSSGDEL